MNDLPFVTEDEESGPSEGATLASHVFIIDDELVIREVIHKVLSREQDLTITTFGSAEAALQAMRDTRVDVALVDKNLPSMSGIDFMAEARKVQPLVESILMTGYPSPESVIAAMAAGASDYLVKPFEDITLLRAKVRAALERRAERIRNRELAKTVAKQASDLLASGSDAPEPAWQKLEEEFGRYDLAVRAGGEGTVKVVGADALVDELTQAGLTATASDPQDPELDKADVVLVQTGVDAWRELVEKLRPLPPDVMLVAAPGADMADLLDAMSLKLELVGFGGHSPGRVADRVRGLLLRRGVQRAQGTLASALAEFRKSLKAE